MEIATLYNLFLQSSGLTTDTRQIKSGSIFLALKGEKFDANTFAEKALEAGAGFVIIDNADYKINEKCIVVNNCLQTLQALAKHHRHQFQIPVLAICGSNGKTTTKELVSAVLSTTNHIHFTKGNFNNHIGVPLTLLAMPADTDIAVIEIGANHLKETADLCQLVLPTHGIVTNNGKDHLEGFGNLENVKKANAELYDYLKSVNGIAFVNAADQDLKTASAGLGQVFYSTTLQSGCFGKVNSTFPTLSVSLNINGENFDVESKLAGAYNIDNILAAACIGHFFGVKNEDIKSAIESYSPSNNRSQWVEWNGNHVLLDCYNANPSSMQKALESFSEIESSNKIAILGDMFELGEYSLQEHKLIIEYAETKSFSKLILIGKDFGKVKSANSIWFETTSEAKDWLQLQLFSDCFILIKASRGMALELLIQN